jgi:hypothetical protein
MFAAVLLNGCANPHVFPRTKPLFAGFDESSLGPAAKAKLNRAKIDFLRAKHDEEPLYAKYLRTLRPGDSREYRGNGYTVTIVHTYSLPSHQDGPRILLTREITGGAPFEYDEVDETVD